MYQQILLRTRSLRGVKTNSPKQELSKEHKGIKNQCAVPSATKQLGQLCTNVLAATGELIKAHDHKRETLCYK